MLGGSFVNYLYFVLLKCKLSVIFSRSRQLFYLVKSLVAIGSVSFGGYMALIAMVRDKFVIRDRVITDDQVSEAITIASLLPGPLAVNVVAYIGYTLAGVVGAFCSIAAVLLPSYLMVLGLSILYIEFNSAFDFNAILVGIIPVVIAIIFQMALTLWKKNCTSRFEMLIAILSFFILLIFQSYSAIVLILLGAAFMGVLFIKPGNGNNNPVQFQFWLQSIVLILLLITLYFVVRYFCKEYFNWQIFDTFAQASITLFGGGYVMVPVLKSLMVDQLGWTSIDDFLFGISIGQVTPGPILISAAFFGYKVNGLVGSFLATAGMFIPTSVIMISVSHFYAAIKSNRWLSAALGGIRPAIVGLIVYSGVSLIFTTQLFARIEYVVVLILFVLFLLIRFHLSPWKAVILGALIGYFVHLISGYL